MSEQNPNKKVREPSATPYKAGKITSPVHHAGKVTASAPIDYESLRKSVIDEVRATMDESIKDTLANLLTDSKLRADIIDIAIIRERKNEPTQAFRDYLAKRKERTCKK